MRGRRGGWGEREGETLCVCVGGGGGGWDVGGRSGVRLMSVVNTENGDERRVISRFLSGGGRGYQFFSQFGRVDFATTLRTLKRTYFDQFSALQANFVKKKTGQKCRFWALFGKLLHIDIFKFTIYWQKVA